MKVGKPGGTGEMAGGVSGQRLLLGLLCLNPSLWKDLSVSPFLGSATWKKQKAKETPASCSPHSYTLRVARTGQIQS